MASVILNLLYHIYLCMIPFFIIIETSALRSLKETQFYMKLIVYRCFMNWVFCKILQNKQVRKHLDPSLFLIITLQPHTHTHAYCFRALCKIFAEALVKFLYRWPGDIIGFKNLRKPSPFWNYFQ